VVSCESGLITTKICPSAEHTTVAGNNNALNSIIDIAKHHYPDFDISNMKGPYLYIF
jgi:hypothetical protein